MVNERLTDSVAENTVSVRCLAVTGVYCVIFGSANTLMALWNLSDTFPSSILQLTPIIFFELVLEEKTIEIRKVLIHK
jgi:hypothetical protein